MNEMNENKPNMEGIHVILAISGLTDNDAKKIRLALEKQDISISRVKTCFRKMGVSEYLYHEKDADLLLVSENLEEASPYTAAEFIHLDENFENLIMIPILAESRRGDAFVAELFQGGVMNALYQNDAGMDVIASLIKEPRTRKSAKKYYGIKEAKREQMIDIASCVEHIVHAETLEDSINHAKYIQDRVGEEGFNKVMQALPEDVKKKFISEEQFLEYLLEKPKDAGIKSYFSLVGKLLRKGERGEERQQDTEGTSLVKPALDLRKIILNIHVGVCSFAPRSGATTQTISLAMFLTEHSYQVAVLERDTVRHKCLALMAEHLHIEVNDGFFQYGNVDFYINVDEERLTEIQKEQYNFLISDFGVYNDVVKTRLLACRYRVMTVYVSIWDSVSFEKYIASTTDEPELYYWFYGVNRADQDSFLECFPGITGHFVERVEGFSDAVRMEAYEVLLADYLSDSGKENKKKANKVPLKKNTAFRKEKETSLVGRSSTSIFVTSLRNGTGMTHLSISLARMIAENGTGSTCYYSHVAPAALTNVKNLQISSPPVSCEMVAASNRYVIYDCDILTKLSDTEMRELRRADYKVMLCLADEAFLSDLAKFITKLGNAVEEWDFVFNMIPKEKQADIRKLMKGYRFHFLPTFLALEPDAETRAVLSGILQ